MLISYIRLPALVTVPIFFRLSREGDRPCAACAYVKHSILNSAIEQKLRDRRIDGRANATSSASGGSVLVIPSIQKVRTKFIKKTDITAVRHSIATGVMPPGQGQLVMGRSNC